MKLMATFLVAVFLMAVGTSYAFGDCAAHSKAQLVKNQGQEQLTKESQANTGTTFAVAEKVAETAKPADKTDEKK
jgi:hypothetical protein